MKMISAVLGMALVIVSGTAIHLWREVDAGRQQLAALQAQLEQRDAQLAALAARPLPQLAASAFASPAPVPVPTQATPPRPDAAANAASSFAALLMEQQSSPEMVARRRQTGRMLMETTNPGVAEALGLTPDEKEKLLELLLDHQERSSAFFAEQRGSGAATSAEERTAAFQAREKTNEAELQALLGNKYPQWQDYKEARPAWRQLEDLRVVSKAGGAPLTEAQSRSLVAALSTEHRAFTEESRSAVSQGRPANEILARNTPERQQRLLAAAAPHLSPQQLEGYRGMLERAAAQERTMLAPLRQAIQAGAATPPSQ
jgi:hypothetical protein